MNIFHELSLDIKKHCSDFFVNNNFTIDQAVLEVPKDPLNGDISTNIAMIIASKTSENPREIALKFKENLSLIPYIAHIEVAGPGFINFTIKAEKWHQSIKNIISEEKIFWQVNVGCGEKVNIEYVSANPTGPMHVGHSRGAVYGDALANVLSICGYQVTREYYINDAGSQIEALVDSAYIRYQDAVGGTSSKIPEGLYPGLYLKDFAEKIAKIHGDSLLNLPIEECKSKLRTLCLEEMMSFIKSDLNKLKVNHDIFFSEISLHQTGKIEQVVDLLMKKGLIYEGILPPPKGHVNDNWHSKLQLLFKSTNYGDDQDRPIKKADGSWSYLAADFAYAKDKIDRGYNHLIYILGADHNGYVKRIKGVIEALSDGKVNGDVRTNQLVNFVKGTEQIKMSKRSGNFMTVTDVINEVGADAIRFMMLTRRNDATIDFDFEKIKEHSKDNPVFYVQYAHVRTHSIIANAAENIKDAYDKFMVGEYDLSLLSSEEEIQLIKLLASWPRVLAAAAKYFEPHRVAYYLIDVASIFHSIWHLGKEDKHYRFNIVNNPDLTSSRLALAKATQKIIANGFSVIGVTPMDKM